MRTGIILKVSATDRQQLAAIVADRNAPQKHVWRSHIVLLTADGCGTAEIMRRAGTSKTAVWRWQERFMTEGVEGGALSDTADHLQTLTKARAQPHVLDDATIDRVERVHREQLQFVDIYAEQLRRWLGQGPSAARRQELDRLEEKNRNLRQVTTEVLTLATELRKGTIDRITAMIDLELGLQALLGTLPPGRS
jgi:hypothetical protein